MSTILISEYVTHQGQFSYLNNCLQHAIFFMGSLSISGSCLSNFIVKILIESVYKSGVYYKKSNSCFFHSVLLFRHSQSHTYLYNSCKCTSYLLSFFFYPVEETEDVSSTKKQKSKFVMRLKVINHSILKMLHLCKNVKLF